MRTALHRGLGLPLVGLLTFAVNFVAGSLPMRPLPPPQGQQCPDMCRESGNSANWTVVARFEQLSACSRPILLEFSLDIPTTDNQFIHACDAWGSYYYYTPPPVLRRSSDEETERVVPQLAWSAAATKSERNGLRAATVVKEVQSHLQRSEEVWDKTILFGAFGGATVGVYIGENMMNPSVATLLFAQFIEKIQTDGIAADKSALLQVCGENRTGDQTFGVIAVGSNDFSIVQAAVKQWSNATCVDISSYAESSDLPSIPILTKSQPAPAPASIPSNSTTSLTNSKATRWNRLTARAECTTTDVKQGETCELLAVKCKITPAEFTKYNPSTTLCSTLTPGQHVCCSAGTLPDFKPKPGADGSCATYTTKPDDNCYEIAAANGLTAKDLETFNKQTWGWAGCDSLWIGVRMCLSTGDPPMPAPISNAVCGPQKPDTPVPPKGTNITMLNPCPLNVCCNIWGQCGTTTDFCIDTRGNGAPGTAAKGTYGCISNCGMDIVKGDPPAQFIKLGYFEAFNLNRECLNMDVTQVDKTHTHIHFAFGMLTDNFEVFLEDEYARFQFEQFKSLQGPKRILSFGGWTFSAERPYYTIFRNGVKSANRDKMATNIAKFVIDNGLDGVDIDWEYPGAPDIPGIPPPDDPNEATYYAAFLKLLRTKLKATQSLSIAAPASYWYLKQFPIAGIAKIVDYIVYMTYDLHGQWDSTNKWTNPGCPSGSCLRSHINITETLSALSMITKAGVPSSKVIVGVSSYGRSFQMVDPSCTGPNCLFTGGPEIGGSAATKGRCTDTAGYISNAEIKEIAGGASAKSWYDSNSDSNMMTFGDTWVAYMNEAVRTTRSNKYKSYNMGGTTNWAVDLDKFVEPPNYVVGSDVVLSWTAVKKSIVSTGGVTNCDRELRTGTWVSKECNSDEVASPFEYLPSERWANLDADHAWNDAKYRWTYCDRPSGNAPFSQSVAAFFHFAEGSQCSNLALVTNCNPDATCLVTNGPSDALKSYTGASAYFVWNSLTMVHAMVLNYLDSIKQAGVQVQNKKAEFLDTFAPDGNRPDYALGLGILFTILQIPSTTLGTIFWKGAMKQLPTWAGNDNALRLDMAKDTSQALVMAGYAISQRFIKDSTLKEVSFNLLYDKIIKDWVSQLDALIADIFKGSDENLRTLSEIIKQGKMISGSLNGNAKRMTLDEARETIKARDTAPDHTDSFLQSLMTERVFYAAAIPSVWKMRKPYAQYPVILDFGPDCNRDIGSGQFFHGGEPFNNGWICINGHNYILASTYDRDNDGPNCSPEYWMWCLNGANWKPLFSLPGLDKIKTADDKFGSVTVEDLVVGAVNTWKRNGKLNLIDDTVGAVNPTNKDDFNDLWDNDIRAPGSIRIPVCSPQEATFLATDGLGHGIPKENIPSFPCLRDPSKRYESEWVTWPEGF